MAELILPQASDWINALEAGQKAGMVDRRNRATTQAGGLMAAGDYAGAARSLYGAGDFQSGAAIADAGYKQTERADKETRQKAVQEKLAAGDFSGAYAAAGADSELLGGLDKVAEHAKETTSTLAGALQSLKDPRGQWLPADVARQRFAAIKPTLLARGLDARQLDGYDPTPENNAAIEGQVLGLAEQLKLRHPDWHEVKGADGSSSFKDLNPYNRDPGGGASSEASVAAAPAAAAAPTGGVYDQVGQIAVSNGAKPDEVSYLQRLAQVESSGRPNAQNGSSTGVFQFHPDTFAKLGGHDIHSVPEQTYAALTLQRRDRENLQQIGVEPTDANAYIMHQQGAGGGRALLTADPTANAIQVLTPVYGSADMARKAIVNNGGTPDTTAGQFVGMWRQRWAGGGRDQTRQAPTAARVAGPASDGAPTITGSAAQAPEWQSDGHGLLINRKTGDRKVDPSVEDTGGQLTGDALDYVAQQYVATGQLPSLGMGKVGSANRAKVINRAAAIEAETGASGTDAVQRHVMIKSTSQALTQITKSVAANTSYEETARANGDLMLSLAPKGGGQTNIPVVNRWLQAGRKQVAGDADVTRFDNALGAFSEEYAKVMTGNLGNVAATDSARKAAAERLASYATQGQLAGGLDVMNEEMSNRSKSLRDEQARLQNQLLHGGRDAPDAAPKAGPKGPSTWDQMTAAQRKTAATFKGKPAAPTASEGNPAVPVSEAQFEALAPGSWFINPADGRVMRKTH